MPVLVTVAWLVLSVRTFLKCACVFSGVSLVAVWLWHLPQVKNRMLLFTPSLLPLLSFNIPASDLKVEAGICHLSLNLNQWRYSPISSLSLPLSDSIYLHLLVSILLSLFIFLPPSVESLPNEVADGSILQRDRVERSPTLKSINLTVSISAQTSLSYESKRSVLALELHYCASHLFSSIFCSHLCLETQIIFTCFIIVVFSCFFFFPFQLKQM